MGICKFSGRLDIPLFLQSDYAEFGRGKLMDLSRPEADGPRLTSTCWEDFVDQVMLYILRNFIYIMRVHN